MANSNGKRGRTLKLYLVDGTPSGVITAELGVSSVRALVSSRTVLPELVKREEAARTGVYLLVGPDPADVSRNLVYVGEGDQVRTRLTNHDADESKDFFTRAVFVVSKDENLTKAHGRYLEGRIINAIKTAGRAKLVNGTAPPFKGLPEAEIADMERVLDEIEILFPVLGFDVLRSAGQEVASAAVPPTPVLELTEIVPVSPAAAQLEVEFWADIKKASAKAIEKGGEFVVLAGSTAYRSYNASLSAPLKNLHAALQENGSLVADVDPSLLRFAKDVSFGSPSAASSLIGGYSDSGPRTWKVLQTGQSYGEWRKAKLSSSIIL